MVLPKTVQVTRIPHGSDRGQHSPGCPRFFLQIFVRTVPQSREGGVGRGRWVGNRRELHRLHLRVKHRLTRKVQRGEGVGAELSAIERTSVRHTVDDEIGRYLLSVGRACQRSSHREHAVSTNLSKGCKPKEDLVCRVIDRVCDQEYDGEDAVHRCGFNNDRSEGYVVLRELWREFGDEVAAVKVEAKDDQNGQEDVDAQRDGIVGRSVSHWQFAIEGQAGLTRLHGP